MHPQAQCVGLSRFIFHTSFVICSGTLILPCQVGTHMPGQEVKGLPSHSWSMQNRHFNISMTADYSTLFSTSYQLLLTDSSPGQFSNSPVITQTFSIKQYSPLIVSQITASQSKSEDPGSCVKLKKNCSSLFLLLSVKIKLPKCAIL